ncbi:MAG TPA: hypothetical protein PLG43_12410 [Spirochaetia bacterium]|nr:hypothetical protein [Spirochaetia bacterium]
MGVLPQSSCYECPGTPCCRYLPVKRFKVHTRSDVETLLSLLERPRIEIGLFDSGDWTLYYHSRCRFLLDTGACSIYDDLRRPEICADYGAGHCWYRYVFMEEDSLSFIRFNEERFRSLMPFLTYLPSGEIDREPEWEEMLSSVPAFPLLPVSIAEIPDSEEPAHVSRDEGSLSPARYLYIELPVPESRLSLDFFAFRLGFRGTGLVIGEVSWGLVVYAPLSGRIQTNALSSSRLEGLGEQSVITDLTGFALISKLFTFKADGRVHETPNFHTVSSVLHGDR